MNGTRVTVAKVGRHGVLGIVGRGGHGSLGPFECERVEDVNVDGRVALQLIVRHVLAVATERVYANTDHR